ncbi:MULTISPECIES: RDD family protein [Bacillus]|uniref:RDD family protein n=1 Tax=Bacillus TaxID=1386 RepID=UPI001BEC9ED1|nr:MULTISPECIES: RDD family protein [Bacillus]MBT2623925.1 RDD family protein [Bacillus sp. ISL-32]MCI3196181.1 RDD family protein [Bacillus sp. HU-1818]MCY8514443.1 RDD family protein [Bacillus atrophaeus]MCY8517679.1 RDD family protein [Bacillus atrophaeus]MCY8991639.1 RDD family protein [Bacillus atrophaeus]
MDATYEDLNRNEAPSAEKAELFERAYAGFWIRFWAFLLDWLVVWGLNHLIVSPLFSVMGLPKTSGVFTISAYSVTTLIVFLAYFALMTKCFSQTLGKMVFGLKVVSIKPDTSLTWSAVIFREVVGRYILKIWILYIVVGVTPKKQGIHDYFADTTVVHEKLYRK